jgi:hypothetical protein
MGTECKIATADQRYLTGSCRLLQCKRNVWTLQLRNPPTFLYILHACLSGVLCNPFLCKRGAGMLQPVGYNSLEGRILCVPKRFDRSRTSFSYRIMRVELVSGCEGCTWLRSRFLNRIKQVWKPNWAHTLLTPSTSLFIYLLWIWGSHIGEYFENYLMGCDAMQSGKCPRTFHSLRPVSCACSLLV